MAANKENLVYVLDIRAKGDKNFRRKAINFCADIIKRKICQGRKDHISFVVVGTGHHNDSPIERSVGELEDEEEEEYGEVYGKTHEKEPAEEEEVVEEEQEENMDNDEIEIVNNIEEKEKKKGKDEDKCSMDKYVERELSLTLSLENDEERESTASLYTHVRPYDCFSNNIAYWQLLSDFHDFLELKYASTSGNWLVGVSVACSLLKIMEKANRIRNLRMILLYDFNDAPNNFRYFSKLTNYVMENDVQLNVVAPNIEHYQRKDGSKGWKFSSIVGRNGKEVTKSKERITNEKYLREMISICKGRIGNIDSSLCTMTNLNCEQSWMWNSQLRIGNSIVIDVCAIILSKYESKLNLKKVWTKEDEILKRDYAYYIGGNEVNPEVEDLVAGYMVGGTPIAYDESLNNNNDDDDEDTSLKVSKGLMLVGFILRSQFCSEYISGPTTYLLMHQKHSKGSAAIMDALVRVLIKMNRVALCWKVFSDRCKKISVVVLVPKEATDSCPAAFYMYEVATHAQYHYFQFPKLISKSTECTEEQYKAIDNLIDAMDLTTRNSESVKSPELDLLPFSELQNVFEVNLMDALERKVLLKVSDSKEVMDGKKFVEKFWKLPESIEKQAKVALNGLKDQFSLEVSMAWLEEAKAKMKRAENSKSLPDNDEDLRILTSNALNYDHVRHASPAEDFENLLEHYVVPLQNNTLRDIQFQKYALQIRCVIWDLLFKSNNINREKVAKALLIYRLKALIFNAFDDYNQWMQSLKKEVIHKSLYDFWEKIIVQQELGLCFSGPITNAEMERNRQFYDLDKCSQR